MRKILLATLITIALVLAVLLSRAGTIEAHLTAQLLHAMMGPTLAARVHMQSSTLALASPGIITVSGATVHGVDPLAPPLVLVERITARVNLWELFWSAGTHVDISRLDLAQPTLRLLRTADGRCGLPPDPGGQLLPLQHWLADREVLHAGTISVTGGTILCHGPDAEPARTWSNVSLQAANVRPGQDLHVVIAMDQDEAGHPASISLDFTLRPLPTDFSLATTPEIAVHVAAAELDLARLAFLFPPAGVLPASGRASADLHALIRPPARSVEVRGSVTLQELRLTQHGEAGAPINLALQLDVLADDLRRVLELRSLEVTSSDAHLNARLTVHDVEGAGIRDALVTLKVRDLARLMAVLPPSSEWVPADLKLAGPAELRVEGDANIGSARVDLDGAHIVWGSVMDKAPGVPLRVLVEAERRADRIHLTRVDLVLDEATAVGSANLPTSSTGFMEAELDSEPVALGKLQRVFPPFTEALRRGGRVKGSVRLRADLHTRKGQANASAQFLLSALDVNAPTHQLRGNALLTLTASLAGDEGKGQLHATLDDLAIRVLGKKGEVPLDKPRGHSANVLISLTHNGKEGKVERADVNLGQSNVQVRGTVLRLASPDSQVDLQIGPLHLAFDDLRAVSELAHQLPAGGTLDARGTIKGNPRKPQTLVMRADPLELRLGTSHLDGTLSLTDTQDPVIRLDLDDVDIRGADVQRLFRTLDVPQQWRAPLRAIPVGGRAQAQVGIAGKPRHPESVSCRVTNLKAHVGKSHVSGSAVVTSLARPFAQVRLETLDVELADLQAWKPPAWLPRTGRVEGALSGQMLLADQESLRLDVERLAVAACGSEVLIKGTLHGVKAPELALVVRGTQLNLQRVMDETGQSPQLPGNAMVPVPGLPDDVRARLSKARGTANIVLDSVSHNRTQLTDVVALVRLEDGALLLDRLSFVAFGAEVNADGSRIDMASARMRHRWDVQVQGLDIGEFAQVQLADPTAMSGTLAFSANLNAVGLGFRDIQTSLAGPFSLESEELRLRDFVLLFRAYRPEERLEPLDDGGGEAAAQGDPRPYFRNLSIAGQIQGTTVTLSQPLRANTSFGDLALLGTVDAEDRMRLSGTTDMSPEVVRRMTRGTYAPSDRVTVPILLGGTWERPVLERLEMGGFVTGLGRRSLLDAAQVFGKTRLEAARAAAEMLREEGLRRAQDEAARLQIGMERERDDARRQQAVEEARQESNQRSGVKEEQRLWNGLRDGPGGEGKAR